MPRRFWFVYRCRRLVGGGSGSSTRATAFRRPAPWIAVLGLALVGLVEPGPGPVSSEAGESVVRRAGADLAAVSGGQRLQYLGDAEVLGPEAPRVGEWIADREVETLDGRLRLANAVGPAGLVIAVRDPGCPVSRKYGPRLASLEAEFSGRGFGFLYVNPVPHATRGEVARELDWYGFGAPYALDPRGELVGALEAVTSTEVFVLDAARTLVYRGAVDDQYGLGFTRPGPRRRWLRDALEAVAAGGIPEVRATMAPGCYLSLEESTSPETEVTWHNRISRIVQERCQRCHRPGAAGPFPFMTYEDVARRRGMIRWVLSDGIMPPWFAAEGSGRWANDSGLDAEELRDFLGWLDGGTPEGDPADAPLERDWPDGWTIGEPDLVVEIPDPITVPAEGVVDYQYVYAQVDLPEDRWVEAVEILPGAPEVVHHVLVFLESPEILRRIQDDPEDDEARRAFQGGLGGYFASMVPGQQGLRFPDGHGKRLPAKAWLKFQLHYTPNGREMVDRTRIGLVFGDGPVHTAVRTTAAFNPDFVIPAGAENHEVQAAYRFEQPAALLSLFPHTHLRGTGFLYELVYPDGTVEELLPVPRYDFNWQLNYVFRTPREVPAGTILRATAWYDNSAGNPANPDPTVDVEFGEQTFEEMMIGYVNWVPVEAR